VPLDDEWRDAVTGEQRGREHADQAAADDENRVSCSVTNIYPLGVMAYVAWAGPTGLRGMNSRRLNFQPASVFA
jgi:hypothetical protein